MNNIAWAVSAVVLIGSLTACHPRNEPVEGETTEQKPAVRR